MVTLNQFIMYCIRNGIQTIRLYQCYNTVTKHMYCKASVFTKTLRHKEDFSYENVKCTISYTSPLHFYEYCLTNLHRIEVVKGVMRSHMMSECPESAMFIDKDNPF